MHATTGLVQSNHTDLATRVYLRLKVKTKLKGNQRSLQLRKKENRGSSCGQKLSSFPLLVFVRVTSEVPTHLLSLPPSRSDAEVTLAEVVGTHRHRTESTQGLCQDGLTTAGHFPALLHTTGSLNLLFLEISFSTWQVIFNFASFERALRGHYHPVPKLLSGLELMWEQRARTHSTLPPRHPHVETQLNLGWSFESALLEISLPEVSTPQNSKEWKHSESLSINTLTFTERWQCAKPCAKYWAWMRPFHPYHSPTMYRKLRHKKVKWPRLHSC